MIDHIIHFEDMTFLPVEKIKEFGKFITTTSNLISGSNNVHVSRKYDGSPSLVSGYDSKLDTKFVATKGFFNKSPVFFTDHESIDDYYRNHTSRNLPMILKTAFDTIEVDRPGYIQYDVMFSPIEPIKSNIIKPNIIGYQVLASVNEKLGIAPHTFVYENDWFSEPPDKFAMGDVYKFPMTIEKYVVPNDKKTALHIFIKDAHNSYMTDIDHDNLDDIKMWMKRYHNYKLVSNISDDDKDYIVSLTSYVDFIFDQQVNKLKTQKACDKTNDIRADTINSILDRSDDIIKILGVHLALSFVREKMFEVLSDYPATSAHDFIRTCDGNTDEGFVVRSFDNGLNRFGETIFKIVNREQFSAMNFQAYRNKK